MRLLIAILFLFSSLGISQEKPLVLTSPAITGGLAVRLKGLQVKNLDVKISEQMNNVYILADDTQHPGFTVSAWLQKVDIAASPAACRELWWSAERKRKEH